MKSASERFDEKIRELADWRGGTLALLRKIVRQADPEMVEEWKWVSPNRPGTPIFSHAGIVCTGEAYKGVVKTTFARGAALRDPAGLFNSSLEGNVRRAIDFHEGDKIDAAALTELVQAAVALNLAKAKTKTKTKPDAGAGSRPAAKAQQQGK